MFINCELCRESTTQGTHCSRCGKHIVGATVYSPGSNLSYTVPHCYECWEEKQIKYTSVEKILDQALDLHLIDSWAHSEILKGIKWNLSLRPRDHKL